MHAAEIFQQRPVGGIAAQGRLPGVHMGVDQAGDDDAVLAVDGLGLTGATAKVDRRAHIDDAIALDQHIAGAEVADRVIHADDGGRSDQRAPHRLTPPL
jgi:inorganic pyrophosphatase